MKNEDVMKFNTKQIFVDCACRMHALNLEYWKEDKELYFCYYTTGRNQSYTWKEKLQHIWQIIIKGHPYKDDLIFYEPQIKELKKFINGIDI